MHQQQVQACTDVHITVVHVFERSMFKRQMIHSEVQSRKQQLFMWCMVD